MSQAAEIYSQEFDSVFSNLPPRVRELVEAKIQELGSHLAAFPHHRLKGRTEYRLRAAMAWLAKNQKAMVIVEESKRDGAINP